LARNDAEAFERFVLEQCDLEFVHFLGELDFRAAMECRVGELLWLPVRPLHVGGSALDFFREPKVRLRVCQVDETGLLVVAEGSSRPLVGTELQTWPKGAKMRIGTQCFVPTTRTRDSVPPALACEQALSGKEHESVVRSLTVASKRRRSHSDSSSESDLEGEVVGSGVEGTKKKKLKETGILDADRVWRYGATAAGATEFVRDMQGLLRIWSAEFQTRFIFNFQVNMKLLHASLHRAAKNDYPLRLKGSSLETFIADHGHFALICDLGIMESEVGLNLVARGRWALSEPVAKRVRLHHFARDFTGWTSKTHPASHYSLSSAVRTLQQVIAILWGAPFEGILDGVLGLLEGREKVMRFQPIAYLAHRLELAMGAFQAIVFDPDGTEERDRRRTPAGCASILWDLLGEAMQLTDFEGYPHLFFFRAGGIYDQYFATIRSFNGGSAAAAGTTTAGGGAARQKGTLQTGKKRTKKDNGGESTGKATGGAAADREEEDETRICYRHAAKVLGSSSEECRHQSECKFRHYKNFSSKRKARLVEQLTESGKKGELPVALKALLLKAQL
jgi:hypothetical protein